MLAKPKLNINMVAKLAGVSTTTISNFINCTEKFPISKEKQARIMGIMREHNYSVNSSSSMIRRKKQLPGQVVFIYGNYVENKAFRVIQNPMISQLLLSLNSAIMDDFSFSLDVRSLMNENSLSEWNEVLLDAKCVINYGQLNPILGQLVQRKNIPFLIISDTEPDTLIDRCGDQIEADMVYWETRKHPEILLDHLRSLGVKKTVYISSWNVLSNRENFFALEAQAKIDSYNDYLKMHSDISGNVITPPIPDNYETLYEIRNTYNLLMERPEILKNVDAVLAHNDAVAQGVIAALHNLHLTPGKDVMVTGEGNFAEFRYTIPAVTTVTYDSQELVNKTCGLIRKKLNYHRYYGEKNLIPSHIISKETT